jgi:hypothetical protein
MKDAMKDRSAKTIIYVPVFNRREIAVESLGNMRAVKQTAHLRIIDDASTEFDGSELVAMGDSGEVNAQNVGIDATRINMLMEFAASDYDYCYFTDSDTIHDPAFLDRLFFMHDKTDCMCSLYYSSTKHHKNGFNIDLGDDILIRWSIPGVSMFFDKKQAQRIIQYYLDALRYRPNCIAEARSWDWFFCLVFPQVALSRISYLEHLFVGGLHAYARDTALNPTPYLAAEGARLRRKLKLHTP